MLKETGPQQTRLEMVTLEELVPQDHLLRAVDRYIDFSFIRPAVEHLYCEGNGRPAVDPEQLFKMLFLGYLFGIRSERQLVKEIQVNVAYRWFLGLGLTDKVINASTFSQNRRRRFSGSGIEQEIFDQIVEQAIGQGLVDGKVLYTDSTHLKANANKHKFVAQTVEITPQSYLADLEIAITEDRANQGKKPLKEKPPAAPASKQIKASTTDPDSGYMTREGKPQGFFYLDHRSVDGRHSIITDSYVTSAATHDSVPYLNRLDRQCQRFDLSPHSVGLDAGYQTAAICHGLEARGIDGVIGYRRSPHRKGMLYKRQFEYDARQDVYCCPEGQALRYKTTDRRGYRLYHSDPEQCRRCPLLSRCTTSRNQTKVLTRHVWADSLERTDARRLTSQGKQIYARRKETVERSFADAKQLHGHRYARYRGLSKVQGQALLAAACQNMKKIAMILRRRNLPVKTLVMALQALRNGLKSASQSMSSQTRLLPIIAA